MILLVASLILLLVVAVAAYWWQSRHGGIDPEAQPAPSDDGCCGEHLVCERETLLQTSAQVVYYDDEELDALSGRAPEAYTEQEYADMRRVFDTLLERDVPGWVRSLQLRNIALPPDIRDEALLIVRERRAIGSHSS